MQQIIQDVGTDVGKFMADFSTNYIIALINRKMQDIMSGAVDKITPNFLADDGGDEGDANDGVEEKKEEDKADDAPIAAGVALIGHRIGYGPDRQYHRYYDFAIWSIKPSDSVISKTVRRHKPILDWFNNLKRQVADVPEVEFPKKKLFGKNVEYYTNRFVTMRNYFRQVAPNQAVSSSEYFLKFWGLSYDAKEAAQREIFFAALEATCTSSNIDWNNARWRAQEIGLDADETEMLKVVAVEKVGEIAAQKIRDQVYALAYVPGPVKGKFISSTEAKLAAMISTTVENGWNAIKEKFKELGIKLSELLDKGCEPVEKLVNFALDPVGKLVKQKIDALDDKLNVDDGLNRELKAKRFPPLAEAWNSAQNKKLSEVVKPLIESINKMSDCYKYVGYLRYNLGDEEIGQYVPYLNEIQDNHYRLTIALTDVAYVLSRAGVNAFEPIFKYVDKISDSGFDEKTHAKEVQDAVREGGRRLAIDFFSLPQTVDRACWYCGSTSQKTVMKVGETTTWALADLLGATVTAWKPTSKDDAKAKFLEALKEPLDSFISERVKTFVSAVRLSTANLVARQLLSIIGGGIDEVANTLNDLCSAIPEPIGDKIKPGDIVKYLIEKMANNLVTLGVKLIAKKTETIMYTENAVAEPVDENLVWRLRWAPRLRDYDDDNAEPEGDATKKNEADKDDAEANGDEANADNANANADNAETKPEANGGGDANTGSGDN